MSDPNATFADFGRAMVGETLTKLAALLERTNSVHPELSPRVQAECLIIHYLMSLAIDDCGEQAAKWMVGYVNYLALVENRPLTHPIYGLKAQS